VGLSKTKRKPAALVAAACTALLGGCSRTPAAPPPPDAAAIEAALVAAEEYLGRNEPGPARTILEELIAKAPGEYRAHELMGRVAYVQWLQAEARGDPAGEALLQAAADHYEAAVAGAAGIDGLTAAGLRQSAGEIASAAGRRERALEHFAEAGRLDPASSKHPLYEAQVLLQLRRPGEARRAAERALSLDPDEPFAHAALGSVAVLEGDMDRAIRSIEEARKIDPHALALRVQEAAIRRQCGDPQRALRLLESLDARIRAEEPVAHEIAECRTGLGDHGAAARAWEHRFAHYPGAWLAAVRAAEAHARGGHLEEARRWLGMAALRAPDAPEVRALEDSLRQ
jgi:predicted Zn-dependent protease